jgi:hypothetical protein
MIIMGEKMKNKDIKVFVNLQENVATIQIILKKELFFKVHNSANVERFLIDVDSCGSSYIERKDGKYYFRNVLRDGNERKVIDEKDLSEEEAKEIIRKVIKERVKDKI